MKTFLQKMVLVANAGGAIALLGLIGPRAAACTAFEFNDGDRYYFAKNFDFMFGDGLLIVNRRGLEKQAVQVERPQQWVSRYGSVTYNQYGRELPNGGMNEAGLVVEMLWLNDTRYAPKDARKELSVLQWIQYQLDTARTVAEVIASDRAVRIAEGPGRVHYFVADREGNAAVLELLEGKLHVYTGADLPVRALANNRYEDSLAALRSGHPESYDAAQAGGPTEPSYRRFCAVASRAGKFEAKRETPASFGFAALQPVRHPEFTHWQVVYDLSSPRISIRRRIDETVREIDFAACDFSPEARAMAADLGQPGALAWIECTTALNRAIISTSYQKTPFLREFNDAAIDQVAAFPESYRPVNAIAEFRKP